MLEPIEWTLEFVKIPSCKWSLDCIPDDTSEFEVDHNFTINLKPDSESGLIRADANFETNFLLTNTDNSCGNIKMFITAYFKISGIELDQIKLNAVELEDFRKDIGFIISGHARAHLLTICQSAGIVSIVLPILKP